MEIKEITDYKIWTDFFNQNGSPSFLQSWEWGELQKDVGYQILRLGIYDNNELTTTCLIVVIKSKRGNFLFVPHGPIIQVQSSKFKVQSYISKLNSYLIKLAQIEKYSFTRIAPILEDTLENKNIFQKLGFKTAPIYMHAETVWTLPLFDLSKHRIIADDELLSQMRKTTRYSIRKAAKDGVVIEKRTDSKAVDDFYKIYQETVKREKFVPFSKDYIQKEFKEFNKTGKAVFLFAKISETGGTSGRVPDDAQIRRYSPPVEHRREGNSEQAPFRYLASALIIFTNSAAFYHQGASIHTKVPATYLLQWEAIKEAKKRGCQFYNFWGIYDEKSKRMPKVWSGLSLFKTGFGGKKICYLPTEDYIIFPKYYLTYVLEKLLSWKRGV